MKHAVHIPTGETAYVRECRPRQKLTVLAQFDDVNHEHSHGWYQYPRADFRLPDKVMIKHDVPIVSARMFTNNPIGCAMRHPDGRLVYITGGTYLSNNRVSNFWQWSPINDDGTLGPEEHGYGW